MARVALISIALACAGCRSDPTARVVEQLTSTDVQARRDAARALGKLEPDADLATPALARALTDEDHEVRRLAIFALGEIGPPAQSALPALTAALDDKELPIRLSAALAIQKIDPTQRSHVPVLVEAMRMGEGGVIVSVGQMGENAAWAVPTLISLLKDRRPGVRRLAAEALGKIGPAAENARAPLEAALRDPDDRVRETAEQALAGIRGVPARR